MPTPKSILVVEDETTIREVVRRYLEREGFHVREAADGYACLDSLAESAPDLIVLDLMLPGIDGLTLTRQLRLNPKYKAIPIVMLTAKGETNDRIRGLDLGADDYIPKPFAPREVVSRVNAVLRRTGSPNIEPGERLELGELVIDAGGRSVIVSGKNIVLSAKEFDLLYHFAGHPRQVFTREQLLEQVWGYEFFGDASTVTVHIRRLREKIEADPSDPKLIVTVWGVGYKFEYSNE